jgi:hypothetical protein
VGWEITVQNVLKFDVLASFWRLPFNSDTISTVNSIKIQGTAFSNLNTSVDHSFCKLSQGWDYCHMKDAEIVDHRPPYSYGPARQAFQSPFLIVIGTNGGDPVITEQLLAIGRYISIGNFHASSTVAPIILDSESDGVSLLNSEYNFILIGGPDVNAVSKIAASRFPPQFPVKFYGNEGNNSSDAVSNIHFDSCELNNDSGISFTFPLGDLSKTGDSKIPLLRNRIGYMIASGSIAGLSDVVSFSFSGNTPLTRAPFSNMYADYFVTSPQVNKKGLGGLLLHGFWGNRWEFSEQSGWNLNDC